MVGERRGDLVDRALHDRRALGNQVEERLEAINRKDLGDVRSLAGVLVERQLGELAMLGGELGGRRQLDDLRLAQGALGEGREPAQRLDLVAEELDADGALLGRTVDVEDPAAHRELAPLLDLVDALVAGLDEQRRDVVEVDALAAMEGHAGRPEGRVGDGLGEGHGAREDDRRLLVARESVERRDAQPDEVGRRGDVGRVSRPARRVVTRAPLAEVRAGLAGEVARGPVVGRDDQQGAAAQPVPGLRERREQVGAHARRHVRRDR